MRPGLPSRDRLVPIFVTHLQVARAVPQLHADGRFGELLSLQWSQVRDGEFTVLAAKAKTRVERTIAVLGPVRDILKRRRLGPAIP